MTRQNTDLPAAPNGFLSGGTAVITGAGNGIGAGLARHAASVGMRVVLADIDTDRLAQVEAELTESGASVLAVPTDVRDPEALVALADAAYGAFGSVELLVNNAGLESVGRIWEMSPESWQRMLRVNLDGVFHGIRAFVERMGADPAPSYIVNVASVAAITSGPMNSAYYASKHGVLALTECLHTECAEVFPQLQVSVVCPAAVTTSIFEDAMTDSAEQADTQEMLSVMRGHLREDGISPAQAAQMIFAGVADGQFWITTHPERFSEIAARRAAMLVDRTPPRGNVATEVLQRAAQSG